MANVTVNSEYYCGVLKTLRTHIARKRPDMKWFRHLHYNTCPHTSQFTNAFLEKFNILCISHPAYNPDLAPCDFWLFTELKKTLRGHRFRIVRRWKLPFKHTFRCKRAPSTRKPFWQNGKKVGVVYREWGPIFRKKNSKTPLTTVKANNMYFVTYQLIFNTRFEFLEGSFQLVFVKRA